MNRDSIATVWLGDRVFDALRFLPVALLEVMVEPTHGETQP
jgi:hypothetical protein